MSFSNWLSLHTQLTYLGQSLESNQKYAFFSETHS